MVWRRSAAKLYRTLLLAYPAEFRNEYGAEMERAFTDRLSSESRARVWLEAVADIAFTAPREHFYVLAADLRYGARMLANAPGFALAAMLAMALGIGATTAVFSIINAVLLRSLPYGDPQQLVYVWTPNPRFDGAPVELSPSNADFLEWTRLNHSFSSLATFRQIRFHFGKTRIGGALVGGNFFRTLQARPRFGRAIDGHDVQPGHEHVAVISDGLWASAFGRDPATLGRTLRLDNADYVVIGVMPAAFGYPHREGDFPGADREIRQTDVWTPLVLDPQAVIKNRLDDDGVVVGRLRPGVSRARAQTDIGAIESRLDPLYPPIFRGWQVLLQRFTDSGIGPVRAMLWLLLGAVSFVLLIASSNVANLLVARATGRAHEMGVRAALGAERRRLIRQMLTEAMLLACGGGALGILLAYGAVRLLVRLNPGDIPLLGNASVDLRVLLFATAASLVTGFLFGLLPAVTASRANILDVLKRGGNRGATGGSNRVRQLLLAGEVSLAIVLLAGAGLLIRSYAKLLAIDVGFAPSTLSMTVSLDAAPPTANQRMIFYHALLDRISGASGVISAGMSTVLPLTGHGSITYVVVRGYPNKKNQTIFNHAVTPRYFDAMNIRLLRGRAFTDQDAPKSPPVLIVSRAFAEHYFPGQDAVGRKVQLGGAPNAAWQTVVGVVTDVRDMSLAEAPHPTAYTPFFQEWQNAGDSIDMAVRAGTEPGRMTSSIRDILRGLDPTATLTNVRTMADRVDEASARPRFQTVVLAVFAGVAMFLALVGLYGLIAYAVRQRTAEIGIRIALGASRAHVLAAVTKEGLIAVALGLGVGLVAAFALTRTISSWLYGVTATDPLTFVAAPLLILVVAAGACAIAAWKATRIDPIVALRYE